MAKYPLEQVALIKQKRLDEAERLLKERREVLEKEEKKKRELEEERNKTQEHKYDKLTQLREAMDAGEGSTKIQGMKAYLKVVDAELKAKDIKVKEQEKKVKEAADRVEMARQEVVKKQHDVEKLKEHRQDWEKGVMRELELEEANIADEIGTVRHVRRKDG